MKSIVYLATVWLAFTAFALAQSTTDLRGVGASKSNLPRYVVTDLGTVPGGDGVNDVPFSISNNGLAAGVVSLPGFTSHAALWSGGTATDMGTLGGPDSWSFGVNPRGQASGWAETGISDPNGEDYCGFGTHLICRGFVWQAGRMTPLSTLGGNNAAGAQINNRGDVVGYAENTTFDSNCPSPQILQFKPVVWQANGQLRALPTFPGEAEGAALGINENRQAVGTSGACGPFNGDGTYLVEAHALSWNEGKVTDLGNLGGTGGTGFLGNAAYSVNNHGDVVGHSDLPGDTVTHAFLWTKKTGMQDLGTLPGDVMSFALNINDAGEIVGVSWETATPTVANLRAVIWEQGAAVDLNTLVVPGADAGLAPGVLRLHQQPRRDRGLGVDEQRRPSRVSGNSGTHCRFVAFVARHEVAGSFR
jgi:probable HAF family extracellular repeat protein